MDEADAICFGIANKDRAVAVNKDTVRTSELALEWIRVGTIAWGSCASNQVDGSRIDGIYRGVFTLLLGHQPSPAAPNSIHQLIYAVIMAIAALQLDFCAGNARFARIQHDTRHGELGTLRKSTRCQE